MSFESLSAQLYKDIESGGGVKGVTQKKEIPIEDQRTKHESYQNLGAVPKRFHGYAQNEKKVEGKSSFTQNRPMPRENKRGRGSLHSRPLMRSSDIPERKPFHKSERNWRGSATKNSSFQRSERNYNRLAPENSSVQQSWEPAGQEMINGSKLESMLETKQSRPKDEDVPGFRYTQIKDLLKKDPSELLMHLTAKKIDFARLLKTQLRPDMVMLVAEIFAKISSSHMKENQSALLAHSVQPNILEQFSSYSFNIVAQNMSYSHNQIIKYFENLYILYQDVVDILPSKASETLKDHPTKAVMALQSLKTVRKVPVPPKLEHEYEILMASVESLLELHKFAAPKKSRENLKREWQPGIDFRQLSVHPLPQDLLCKVNVNICPAVIDGPYKSVEHYLDVQFNLMREDFLIPLREGIADFVEQNSSKSKLRRIENVRFYNKVKFLHQFIEGDVIVTEVLFNARAKSSRHNWKKSKRFMYGSLLCFTSDMFSSIILGVIVDRSVDRLEKGILRCELIGDVKDEGLFKKEYIMAENEVYFEAYQHVMRALQNFNERNFPLKEYLIDVSSDLYLPSYLARNPFSVYKFNDFEFHVHDKDFWPTMVDLKVNESQFNALHSALTKKCAVIQGPPGTGKTYLGLIIAKMLLENSACWRENGKGPMLVVCFTNHALDQFLEGMLSFTQNIVRVGSQSKNENLNEYNLRVVRKKKRGERYYPSWN